MIYLRILISIFLLHAYKCFTENSASSSIPVGSREENETQTITKIYHIDLERKKDSNWILSQLSSGRFYYNGSARVVKSPNVTLALYNRTYFFENYEKHQSTSTEACRYSIVNNYVMFGFYFEDGTPVTRIAFECNTIKSEFCCDLDCCTNIAHDEINLQQGQSSKVATTKKVAASNQVVHFSNKSKTQRWVIPVVVSGVLLFLCLPCIYFGWGHNDSYIKRQKRRAKGKPVHIVQNDVPNFEPEERQVSYDVFTIPSTTEISIYEEPEHPLPTSTYSGTRYMNDSPFGLHISMEHQVQPVNQFPLEQQYNSMFTYSEI